MLNSLFFMVNPLKTTPFLSRRKSAEVTRCVTRSWTAPMTAAGARCLGDIGDLKMAILTFWEYMDITKYMDSHL